MRILILIPLFLLAGCGFRPVYGKEYQSERRVATAELAGISVVTPTDRLGQLLGEELRDAFNPEHVAAEKPYRLEASATEVNIPLFVAPDGTYGRGNIQFTANYTLVRVADNAPVHSGTLTRMSSYAASETNAIYASYVAQQDARKRGILELANDIASSIANRLNAGALALEVAKPAVAADPIVKMQDQSDLQQMGLDR